MDTERLRYFVTIARTSSLHRAAELLHVSPAALSKAMKLLEMELDTQLFVRSGRGILVTDEGKQLAERAQSLLTEFEGLKSTPRERVSHRISLKLGSFEVFTTYFLGPLVKDFEGGGGLDLILHELPPGKLEDSILTQEIDIGLTYIPIPQPGLDFLKICTIQMGIFFRKGAFSKATWEELPFAVPVLPIHGSPTKVVGLDGWPDNLHARQIHYRVSLMESALELCRQGLAAAYLPEFVVALHNKTTKDGFQLTRYPRDLPLAKTFLQQHVYLIKRKTQVESEIIKKIAKVLRLVAAS